MQEIFEMSVKELERHNVLLSVKNKQITQLKAAELLQLSTRQIRNLVKSL